MGLASCGMVGDKDELIASIRKCRIFPWILHISNPYFNLEAVFLCLIQLDLQSQSWTHITMPKARHTNASSKKSEIVSGRPEVTELMTNNVTVDKLRFDVNDQPSAPTGDMSYSGWYHAKFATCTDYHLCWKETRRLSLPGWTVPASGTQIY